jgi:tetratricopeptide (TPR) repeat protein
MEESAKAIDYLNSDREENGVRRSGVQHCDIKPYNILITGTSAQVCDFGLARVQGAVRATATLSGTVAYAAPECLEQGGNPSPTTDQYSLAITYYELKTGLLPYSQNTMFAIMQASLDGKLDLSQVTPAEEEVLRRATSRDPSKRFPSCVAMVKALRRAQDSPEAVTALDIPKAAAQASSSRAWIWAIPLILAAIAGAWWKFHNREQKEVAGVDAADSGNSTNTGKPSVDSGPRSDTDQTDNTSQTNQSQQSTQAERPTDTDGNSKTNDNNSDTDPFVVETQQSETPVESEEFTQRLDAADRLAADGNHETAIAEYTQAISLQPASALAHFGRGVSRAKQQDLDGAIQDFERARQLDAGDALQLADRAEPAETYLQRAAQRRTQENPTGALDDTQAVIDNYPKWSAEAYAERGAVERDQHDYQAAIKDLTESIRLNESNPLAYSRRGYVYLQTGQFREALTDLDRAIELEPNDVDYLNRAIAYSAAGKLNEAVDELNSLLERDPQNTSATYQRGLAYRDRMDYADAITDMRSVLEQEPHEANSQAVLAMLLACRPDADKDDLPEALRLATSASDFSERKDAMHLDALAAVQASSGDFTAAQETATAAVELAAGTPAQAAYKQRLELYRSGKPFVLPSAK